MQSLLFTTKSADEMARVREIVETFLRGTNEPPLALYITKLDDLFLLYANHPSELAELPHGL